MTKIPAVLSAIFFFLASSLFTPVAAETVDLTILHINDFHGHLLPTPGKDGKPGTGASCFMLVYFSNQKNALQPKKALEW
jgi:2',3'-cyclic-nucleotide 2'-phosphodiesterase (5'-nucleotidase family)